MREGSSYQRVVVIGEYTEEGRDEADNANISQQDVRVTLSNTKPNVKRI